MDIYKLLNDYPDLTISIKLADLVEFGDQIARKVLDGLQERTPEQPITSNPKDLIPRKEVMKILGVSSSTLWRWSQNGPENLRGYLPYVKIGNTVYYEQAAIDHIIKSQLP